jgi:hypothetical protein
LDLFHGLLIAVAGAPASKEGTWVLLRAKKVRGIIFEPIKPLTIVILQQIDILGASPN